VPDAIDPYKVLQVDPEAEDEVIDAAYRRLARKYHPDVASSPESAARMAAINRARDLIGTPESRATFDAARHATRSAEQAAAGPLARARTRPASGPASSPGPQPPAPPPPTETVSRDWTSGRSTMGGGYDASMRAADGLGAAGPPPGRPSGSVLNFGRYAGWSLGEIARHDPGFLEWLDRAPIGRQYRGELDQLLRTLGRRQSAEPQDTKRRGLFRRG
jgi:curved DNA-binding protein CbpA